MRLSKTRNVVVPHRVFCDWAAHQGDVKAGWRKTMLFIYGS